MDTYTFYPNATPTEAPENHSRTSTGLSSTSSESSGASSGASSSSLQQALQSYPGVHPTKTVATTTPAPATNTLSKPAVPSAPSAPSAHNHPMDPLQCAYPKPTEELDMNEALNRTPGRWTLAHYIKKTPVLDFEEARIAREREHEANKEGLRRAKEELGKMTLPM